MKGEMFSCYSLVQKKSLTCPNFEGIKTSQEGENQPQPSFVSSWMRKAVDYGGRGCVEYKEG